MFKSLIATVVFLGAVSLFANSHKAEVEAQIKAACSAEIATAGCADQALGKGLMKCLHAYKKEHKDFKISKECRSVKRSMHGKRHKTRDGVKHHEAHHNESAVEAPVEPATK